VAFIFKYHQCCFIRVSWSFFQSSSW